MALDYEKCRPDARLHGCVRDVRDVAAALVSSGRFRADQIVSLTDDSDSGRSALTRAGIKKALIVLARRSRAEKLDLVYFHFSGHAVQLPDENGDENDGMDEALVAEDFETGGLLVDDWLNAWLWTIYPATRVAG